MACSGLNRNIYSGFVNHNDFGERSGVIMIQLQEEPTDQQRDW
jgi:hypothetical protein